MIKHANILCIKIDTSNTNYRKLNRVARKTYGSAVSSERSDTSGELIESEQITNKCYLNKNNSI